MYVTFFYPLDRSAFPSKWQRDLEFYYRQFEKLLEKNSQKIIVFSSDQNIKSICQKFFHAQFIFWEKKNFYVSGFQDTIQKCIQKNFFHFNVPEFFSSEYISLQLYKFEVLYKVSLMVQDPSEPIIWIDAGILYVKNIEQSSYKSNWIQPGIHVTQFTAAPICERWITFFPGAYIMGGCFGGQGVYVRRLFYESVQLLHELWEKNISANDQQILSILHYRKPSFFHVQKAFTQWIPYYGSGHWSKAIRILDSEKEESYKNFQWIFLCLLLYLLNERMKLK